MTTADDQLQLHPAADILRDRLLLDVVEENSNIAVNNSRLQLARDFLGKIDLRFGDGCVVSTSLNHSVVIKDYHGYSCLCMFIDCAPLLLSDFFGGSVRMSGQDIGCCREVSLDIDDEDDSIRFKCFLSVNTFVEGFLHGLDSDDLSRLKNMRIGEEQLTHLLATTSAIITLTLEYIIKAIPEELQKTIRILGPRPTFESFDTLHVQLPVDPSDSIECQPLSYSDESRLAIVTSLGCSEFQLRLLEKNHYLKDEQFRLTKIEERLGTVEISHTTGNINLLLKDGELCEGRSGPLSVNENTDATHTGLRFFEIEFHNGAKIWGDFDSEDIHGIETDEIVERMQRTFSGEQPFASTSKLKLAAVSLPFDYVKNVFGVLGVNLGGTVCNDGNA